MLDGGPRTTRQLREMLTDSFGNDDRAMSPACAADRDRQSSTSIT